MDFLKQNLQTGDIIRIRKGGCLELGEDKLFYDRHGNSQTRLDLYDKNLNNTKNCNGFDVVEIYRSVSKRPNTKVSLQELIDNYSENKKIPKEEIEITLKGEK